MRLGVKPATLYAYVSRGLLNRDRAADGRSRFRVAEVDRLAQARGSTRGGRRAVGRPVSSITVIEDRTLRYRGVDASELAAQARFESVAAWLWTGVMEPAPPWHAEPEAVKTGSEAQAALPERALPLDRLRVIVAAVAATDDLRHDTSQEAVVIAARRLLSAMVDCLPQMSPPTDESLAARLWSRFSDESPSVRAVDLVNAALVLIADHELSTSTLAARLAASIRADPYAVVGVGLSALGGALHSVAALAAEDMLAEIQSPKGASAVIGERLRRGERLPGFGHRLHLGGDPRAESLLNRLRALVGGGGTRRTRERWAVVEAVLATTRERGLPPPNVDFVLAASVAVAGLARGASEAIFAVARSAGWLAHALEEYEAATSGSRGARAIYVGTLTGLLEPFRPGSGSS